VAGSEHIQWVYQHVGQGFSSEFGAEDGLCSIPTLLREGPRVWRGILAEASSKEHGDILQTRPNSAVVIGAICPDGTTVQVAGLGRMGRADLPPSARSCQGARDRDEHD